MPATAGSEWRVPRVLGLIVAGGQGRRMGGVDKGLQPLAGRALVLHVLGRLAPQVGRVCVSANRSLAQYQALGLTVFADVPELQGMGPLAGLASLPPHLPADFDAVQLVPCDTPLIPLDLVGRQAEFLAAHPELAACYPLTPAGAEPGMLQVRTGALTGLVDYLQQGGRRVRGWLDQLHAGVLTFDDANGFANVNDQTCLLTIEQQLIEKGTS